MDDFDEERFSRGAQALSAASPHPRRTASRVIRFDADREELLCAEQGRSAVIRVKALSELGRQQLSRELQLLAVLEVSGIAAAPAVLEIQDDGYVREDAAPLQRRRGRRCAEEPVPATAERQAQARARECLDALIDALHDRGWVLGAPLGEGLGVRADGSVTVLDLSGLRPEEEAGARLGDRRWVDSVLRDEGRTLRRRINADGSARSMPPAPRLELEEDLCDDEPEAPSLRPLPAPRALRRPAGNRLWEAAHRAWEVFRAPQSRRIALLSAVAVLIAGGALGSGAWWLIPEAASPVRSSGPASTAPVPTARDPGPRITDPLSLATDLAHARHEYVTGAGAEAVAAPGSVAEAADEQVRRAYEGAEVKGGQPEVLAARVTVAPSPAGTAGLEVEMSTQAHTVTEADGSTTAVAATAAATVRLELSWGEGRWQVVDVQPG